METTQVTIKRYLCRHIHAIGRRCGSPALHGEEFCYYHHTTRRPAPTSHRDYLSPDAAFELPSFEDRASVQLAIAQVARRIAMNQLDPRRARMLLYSIQIASANLPREPRQVSRDDPRDARSQANDLVEEIHDDPTHGPLALVAEVVPPEGPRRGLAQRLLEELRSRRNCPTCNPAAEKAPEKEREDSEEEDQPDPNILPQIQAAAEPTTKPGAPSSTRSGRVGYRATLNRTPSLDFTLTAAEPNPLLPPQIPLQITEKLMRSIAPLQQSPAKVRACA